MPRWYFRHWFACILFVCCLLTGLSQARYITITNASLDTTIDSDLPNTVMGAESYLYLEDTAYGLVYWIDPWDNELIPEHARINSATASFYVDNWDGWGDDEMWLTGARMLEDWDEGTTWSEMGEPYDAAGITGTYFDENEDDQWVAIAVTSVVKEWSPYQYTVGSQQPNYGISIRGSSGECDIDSSEGTNTPQLTIVFTPPGDANDDGWFDQLDIVQVLQAGKYGTGNPATWEQGDWDWDGDFDQYDLVVALQETGYTTGAGGGPLAAFGETWE